MLESCQRCFTSSRRKRVAMVMQSQETKRKRRRSVDVGTKRERDKEKEQNRLSADEVLRLDEVRHSLRLRSKSGRSKKEKLPSGIVADYSANFTAPFAEALSSPEGATSSKKKPPVPPRPPPQRGILKGKSASDVVAGTAVLGTEDVVAHNTLQNELIVFESGGGLVRSPAGYSVSQRSLASYDPVPSPRRLQAVSPTFPTSASSSSLTPSFATPPMSPARTPAGEGLGVGHGHTSPWLELPSTVNAKLPELVPMPPPPSVLLSIPRQPTGDFGFALRRVFLGDTRGGTVLLAEPSALGKTNATGLLPGDRLLEVNSVAVQGRTRDDVIHMIKASPDLLTIKVQPLPELAELSRRCCQDSSQRKVASSLDGEGDAELHGGTLRRSGSRRFQKTQAKTEEEVARELEWLSHSEHVWVVHQAGFAAGRIMPQGWQNSTDVSSSSPLSSGPSISTPSLDDGHVRVCLADTGDVVEIDDNDIEKANPPKFDYTEDLADLLYLNESSCLHTLRQRHASNLVHTYAGKAFIAMHPMAPLACYSDKVMQMFRGCKAEDVPPHIYSVAQTAYRKLLSSRSTQSVAFIGRSGSGKTTCFRHVLECLVYLAGSSNSARFLTVEKITAAFTLLEAFGNCQTNLNNNASRFCQIFSVDFDYAGLVAGGSIQVVLLEKRRVVSRPVGERTFHSFYYLLYGAPATLRKELLIEDVDDVCPFVPVISKVDDQQKFALGWNKVAAACQILGLTEGEVKSLWAVVAAVYHLGIAGFAKGPSTRYHFARPQAAQRAASVLGISIEELSQAIFHSSWTGSSSLSPNHSATPSSSGASMHGDGQQTLEAMAVGLYVEVFGAVVGLVNRALTSNVIQTLGSVMVADCPGFQNPSSCGSDRGASFQDLCYNYLQERLQSLFHHITCVRQQDLYVQEEINCNFDGLLTESASCDISSILDRPPSSSLGLSPTRNSAASPTPSASSGRFSQRENDGQGLFWMLDEVASGSTDVIDNNTLCDKLLSVYAGHDGLVRKGPEPLQFTVEHMNGTNAVTYTVSNWLGEAVDNVVLRRAATVLHESQREYICNLFSNFRGPLGSAVTGSDGTQTLRRVSSFRKALTTGTAGRKNKSVPMQVVFQVDGFIETLRRANVSFVHCFLPQHLAGIWDPKGSLSANSEKMEINVSLLRSQFRGSQILEAVRIYKQGFPEHMHLSEFCRRFQLLSPAPISPLHTSSVSIERQMAEELVRQLDIDSSSVRVGLTCIFFRPSILSQLEARRDHQLKGTITQFQAVCRRYLAQKAFNKRKVEVVAVRCIQRNVRKFIAVRDWPWWRLLVRVSPLLNVHRTEEELRAKTEELETLRARVERLEKERSQFQGDNHRLEAKVSELSVELSEEQATSTLASERLSAETGERKRLEREVQDLQERFETVQQSNDRLESEVLLRRALGINGDLHSEGSRTNSIDEDDVDSRDAVLALQRKCERALQEVAFLKKQMHQQHEDDMDQMMTLKKQLEKKVSEAYEEAEEQRQVSGQWKRKSQKATAELNDLKLLLEEQTSRNALLEKKQRRFDADLQSMQRQLTNEQQQKEQVARERDSIQAQQFASEQSLAALRLDLEVSQNETASLRNELEELSMGGRMEEEVGNLRRQRQEMTTRLREQEEELDDLAGQVQLLEQAKLRLEMALETARKDHRRELQQRDEEVEDARASAAKKYKVLEAQLENEHEERTILLREKHELERKLAEAREAIGRAAEGGENVSRLRRELRHTKALLRDAHTMLERTQEDAPSKALLRQLKNQLEDADLSRAAAMKARQNAEMELAECQMQMDESQRIRSETEERLARILREKTELQAQLDENEEELAEVMKKYKASVQQVSSDQATMQEQAVLLAETESQRNLLREQLAELQARLEAMETDSAASAVQRRLQLKLREAESKLELESTTRARLETQANRLKESVEKLQEEALSLRTKEQMSQEAARRLQRQMHDCREEQAALQHRESSALQKAIASEQRLEAAEVEIASLRADLKLALQRIDDLQAAMHAPSDDSDSNTDDDSDFELDLALPRRHVGEGDADVDDFQLSNMPAAPNNTFSSPSRESQA